MKEAEDLDGGKFWNGSVVDVNFPFGQHSILHHLALKLEKNWLASALQTVNKFRDPDRQSRSIQMLLKNSTSTSFNNPRKPS
jgi:hypothetical protein